VNEAGAPTRRRGRREWHLPEAAYLDSASDLKLTLGQLTAAARITARLVARDATGFEARLDLEVRAGRLPRRADDRSATIERVFDWLAAGYRHPERRPLLHLQLQRGRSLLLEIGSDPPAHGVFLNQTQLLALQGSLSAAGLPHDLYYPLAQRRTLIEPVEDRWGSVSKIRNTFSPLEWQRRGLVAERERAVPSDRERRAGFVASCEAFLGELHFRELITLQRGSGARPNEVQAVRDLALHVQDMIDLTAGRRTASFQRKPTAGWKEPPTAWQALQSAWPSLTRLHPRGGVAGMFTTVGHPDSWHAWVTDDGGCVTYEIDHGVLYGPTGGTPTSPPPIDVTPIFRLPRRGWARLVDSDAAVRIADESGGERMRRGGGLLSIVLLRRVHGRWIWHIMYDRVRAPYSHSLLVYVDIRSGEIVHHESRRSLWLT